MNEYKSQEEFLKDFWGSFKKQKKVFKTYLVKDNATNLYKIGKATDPSKRVNALKVANTSIELYAVCEENVEYIIHKEYHDKQVSREWFRLSDLDVNTIISKYHFQKKEAI